MSTIIVQQQSFSFDAIRQHGKELLEDNPAFEQTFELAQQWLNGNTEFTFFTSGSTGIPKPIVLKRTQLEASGKATIQTLALQPSEHILLCMNTQFIGGAMLLIRGLILGATITLQQPGSNPLQDIGQHHPYTFASFTPLQLYPLLQNKFDEQNVLNQFKHVLIGGAPISIELENTLVNLSVKCYQTYGMTETVSHIALRQIGKDKAYTLLNGIHYQTDARGCIAIQGAVTQNQWIQTNDVVEIVDHNHFHLLGRADDIINSGGIKVWPQKVEDRLRIVFKSLAIPFTNICVTQKPHPQLGEKVIALIETNLHELDWELIKTKLTPMLHKYEIPKNVYLLQQFMYTPSGKINKVETLKMSGL